MTHYRFKIKLVGDAELRTGIGGEAVNSYVPKDQRGLPFIPGSHIKGLMRAAIKEIAEVRTDWEPFFAKDEQPREWPYPLLDRVFVKTMRFVTITFRWFELRLRICESTTRRAR